MKRSIVFLLVFVSAISFAQNKVLESKINTILAGKKAKVGVAVKYQDQELTVNNTHKYPTMSVFKLLQGMALLDYMDKHNIPLETNIFMKKSDLRTDTYSPLRDKNPEGNFDITIAQLLQYTVSHSDNNTSNFLFNKMLGTKATDLYIRGLGFQNFEIVATEHEMSESFEAQYQDWIEPLEAVRILELVQSGKLFSFKYQNFLQDALVSTTSGANKVKGLLPTGTVVAHKTGMGGRNNEGMKAADNDIAIVYLPNGKHFSIAVFVTDSMESDDVNASIIAQISKVVYDYYVNK